MTWQSRATGALGNGYLVLTMTGLVLAPMLDLGASGPAVDHYLRTVDTASFIAGGYLQLAAFVTLLAFLVRLSARGRPSPSRASERVWRYPVPWCSITGPSLGPPQRSS